MSDFASVYIQAFLKLCVCVFFFLKDVKISILTTLPSNL